jgi:RimJ/RimL family protein N-acetyltransferase
VTSGESWAVRTDDSAASEVLLRDGTPALIWPLLPNDRAALLKGFAELSDRSRYRRFLSPTPELTDRLLKHLVDDVDGVNHIALICVALPEVGEERPVGVGRLIRYDTDRTVADIAVTVLDEWQGRGVATALIQVLLGRRPPGVTQLRTVAAANNAAALAMLAAAGSLTTRTERGVVEVDVDLSAADSMREASISPTRVSTYPAGYTPQRRVACSEETKRRELQPASSVRRDPGR